MKALHRFETSGSNYALTQRHMPQGQKPSNENCFICSSLTTWNVWREGGQFHVFLTSVPNGDEWSSSRSARLTLGEQPPLSTACVWNMSHYQLQQNMSIRHMQKHTTAHTGYSCLIFLSIPIIWNENIQQAHSAMSHRRWKFLWPAAHIPL
jgi:hypothetical protein